MWRAPLSRARCLIPALGWYEWQQVERVDERTGDVKKTKQPHFIRLPGGEPVCFAGLMSCWTAPNADTGQITCSILTRSAAESVAEVHDRMPVVLPDDAHVDWLDKKMNDGEKAIAFARNHAILEFEHCAVSDQINRPIGSDASLIEPVSGQR